MINALTKSEIKHLVETSLDREIKVHNGDQSKGSIREMHKTHKQDFLQRNQCFWDKNKAKCQDLLIDGKDLSPEKIRAKLIPIPDSKHPASTLFRLGSFNWSIPTSQGFGRRLRFLVWDEYHNSLIGLIGLTDPVFNLKVRDELIGWNSDDRKARLSGILDAFVLGALPPYSFLLGGKLVASLLESETIQNTFEEKYQGKAGLISGQTKPAILSAITTTSVLGRSSVYNRLRLNGRLILEPIGFTSGYGHFQFSDNLFSKLKTLVTSEYPEKANSFDFGKGPNWKIRVIRDALKLLDIDQNAMNHGIRREVFFCRLFEDTERYLKTGILPTRPLARHENTIARQALERWVIPRASRDQTYKNFSCAQWIKKVDEAYK
ncbi:DUF4338 domain-containing protein [Litorivicinus sp.]|nr:DUF4338 domain-containing protein [Litorivicinus sp.]